MEEALDLSFDRLLMMMKGPIYSVLADSKCPLILMLKCNMVPLIRVQILFRVRKRNYIFSEIHACCVDALISTYACNLASLSLL